MRPYHVVGRVAILTGLAVAASGLGIELNNPGTHQSTYEFSNFLLKAGGIVAAIGGIISYDANSSQRNEVEAKKKSLVAKVS